MKPESNARQEASAREKRRRLPVAWILVAPFLFFYVAFLIYPSIQVAYLSFTNSDITGTGTFVGLQNYAELIRDADFWASLWHTLYFIILTVVPNTAVGFLLALLVIRLKRLAVADPLRVLPAVCVACECRDNRGTLANGHELRDHQLSGRKLNFMVSGPELGNACGRRGNDMVDRWVQHASLYRRASKHFP